jgi:uncharacterized membrane protein
LYLILVETLGLVVALATPIADLFPKGTFDEPRFPVLIAITLIVGTSFLIGLVMRSAAGKRFFDWIENSVLGRLPMYRVLKSLTTGFAEAKEGGAFRPAVLNSPEGERELAYVIEDHGNGQATVLLPWAPTPFAGHVKIVGLDRIEVLDTDLGDFTRVVSMWGVGVRDLLGKGGTR